MTELDDGHSLGRAAFLQQVSVVVSRNREINKQQVSVVVSRNREINKQDGFNNEGKDPEQRSGPSRAKSSKQSFAGIRKIEDKEK